MKKKQPEEKPGLFHYCNTQHIYQIYLSLTEIVYVELKANIRCGLSIFSENHFNGDLLPFETLEHMYCCH